MNGLQPLPASQVAPTSDERLLGMLVHLLAIVAHFVGPLILWLVKRGQSKFVDHHGKEALNFLITVVLAQLICIPLMLIFVGFFLLIGIGIGALVCLVLAAVAANNGEYYRYPVSIRFLK